MQFFIHSMLLLSASMKNLMVIFSHFDGAISLRPLIAVPGNSPGSWSEPCWVCVVHGLKKIDGGHQGQTTYIE